MATGTRRPWGAFEDWGPRPRASSTMPLAGGTESQPLTRAHLRTQTQVCKEKRGAQAD